MPSAAGSNGLIHYNDKSLVSVLVYNKKYTRRREMEI